MLNATKSGSLNCFSHTAVQLVTLAYQQEAINNNNNNNNLQVCHISKKLLKWVNGTLCHCTNLYVRHCLAYGMSCKVVFSRYDLLPYVV